MQAVLTRENTLSDKLENMFTTIETADSATKNSIENDIVNIGEKAADFLIDKLRTKKGVQRGVAAMSLIRIGDAAIDYLKEEAQENKEFQWIANYLIREIKGVA